MTLSGKQNWIKVKLEGVKSNRSAIGARVLVRYGGKVQAQAVLSQSSFYSCNDPRLHFGLGSFAKVDIEIFWPNGLHENTSQFPANQLVTFQGGRGTDSQPRLGKSLGDTLRSVDCARCLIPSIEIFLTVSCAFRSYKSFALDEINVYWVRKRLLKTLLFVEEFDGIQALNVSLICSVLSQLLSCSAPPPSRSSLPTFRALSRIPAGRASPRPRSI